MLRQTLLQTMSTMSVMEAAAMLQHAISDDAPRSTAASESPGRQGPSSPSAKSRSKSRVEGSSKGDGNSLTRSKVLFTTLCHLLNGLKAESQKGSGDVYTMGRAIEPHLQAACSLTTGELLLTPIRRLLVSCTAILYTSSKEVDVYGLIKGLAETSLLTNRSSKAQNGIRLLSVETLGSIVGHNKVLPRVASLIPESLTALSKCSRSSDLNVKLSSYASIRTICDAMVSHHASTDGSKFCSPFVALGALREREVVEILKIVKKGCEDKSVDVRLEAARVSFSGGQCCAKCVVVEKLCSCPLTNCMLLSHPPRPFRSRNSWPTPLRLFRLLVVLKKTLRC